MKKLNYNKLLLFILPLTLIAYGYYLKGSIYCYSLQTIDPEYCYLINGLNLAHLSFPWHLDHPGTPLQILSAMVIRVVHLFRLGSLDMDLFQNPDFYINAINYTIIYLQAVTLLFVGLFFFRFTKNIFSSIFIQLSPFISTGIAVQARVMVEQLEIIAALFLISAVIWFLYSDQSKRNKGFIDKFVIVFAIIIGFGTSIKILFAPLILIPFILVEGYKKKISLSILSLVSFSAFAFPIFNRWVYFRDWIEKLFIHSGHYGAGNANFVDKHLFIKNLNTVFHKELLFPITILLMVTALVIYYIPSVQKKFKNTSYFRALLGFTVSTLIIVVVICKQFKYFYLTPAIILVPFELFLIYSIYFKHQNRPKINWINSLLTIGLAVFLFSHELREIPANRKLSREQNKPYFESKTFINKNFNNKPKLIISRQYGCPYPEYSLFFAITWAGNEMIKYYWDSSLQNLYPDSYVYHGWKNSFYALNKTGYSYIDLLRKYNEVYLYSGNKKVENSIASKLHGLNRTIDTKSKIVYNNNQTGETIYLVSFDSLACQSTISYNCDAEQVDSSGNYFINSLGQKFKFGNTQSNEFAHSGLYAAKLTGDSPYGFTCYLSEVQIHDRYKISTWLYNNNNSEAGLVLSSPDRNLYKFESTPVERDGNWFKIEIDYTVTKETDNKDLKIYCWNKNGHIPAYFDDLTIKRIIQSAVGNRQSAE